MPQYDAVVIGAGNGGLTAALTLAQAGLKTMLLEKHHVPGGCATSFCRGRFEFEVALHQLSGLGSPEKPGPLYGLLQRLGIVDQLEWLPMDNLYRIVLPGQLDVTLPADREGAVKALSAAFPHEKAGIESFFKLVYDFFGEVISAFFMKDPDINKNKYPLYFKYALCPSSQVLDDYFRDPLLKLAITPYWSYMGVPNSKLSFSDLAGLLFTYIEFKPYHLKGGSQALSTAILQAYYQAGGEAWFNCGAERIVSEHGRVSGVQTDNGELLETSYVVSNASTIATYTELLDSGQVAPEFMTSLGAGTIGPSSLTLYVGLDCEPGEIGINEATNFICHSTDVEYAFARFRTIDSSEDSILLTCYNLLDSGFAPAGCAQVAVVDLKYAQPWAELNPDEYFNAKYQAAEILLQRLEVVFPGFRSHIEEVEVATPLTHMRYLGTPGGAIYGMDQYIKDSNLFTSNRSPVGGLYMAGAWAGSGGFEPTLRSGVSAARALLKERGQRG